MDSAPQPKVQDWLSRNRKRLAAIAASVVIPLAVGLIGYSVLQERLHLPDLSALSEGKLGTLPDGTVLTMDMVRQGKFGKLPDGRELTLEMLQQGKIPAVMLPAAAPEPIPAPMQKRKDDQSWISKVVDTVSGTATTAAMAPAAPVIIRVEKKRDFANLKIDNPYRKLPNPLDSTTTMTKVWSAKDEETLRAGLTHKFTWQRYKTVQDLRDQRLQGSSVLLFDALKDQKLWIRMRALITLADFGIALTNEPVKTAIGDSSDELVSRFFKRFTGQNAGVAERYVMRAALAAVSTDARTTILHVLAQSPDDRDLANLYMIAGLFDTSPKVRDFARHHLPNIPEQEIEHYKEQVLDAYNQTEVSVTPAPIETKANHEVDLIK